MTSGLQDILPPPQAPEGIGVLTVITIIFLLLTCVALLRYFLAPRKRARRRVMRLRSSVKKGETDIRTAAHTLAASLRQGLGEGFSTVTDTARWSAFSNRLSASRFAQQSCSVNEFEALLEEALYWLERSR